MKTCKRTPTIRRYAGAVAGVEILLPRLTAEATIRAVDAAFVPIAFTARFRHSTGDTPEFHFSAGEALTLADLMLEAEQKVVVSSAAGSAVELLLWEG